MPGAARAHAHRSVPRTAGATADRRRSSARRGSADRDHGSAQQHSPSFCRMPPDSFFAGRSAKGARPVLSSSSAIARVALGAACPNRRPKNSMFSRTLRSAIEVLAQALRHIGDARADVRRDAPASRHVAAEHVDAARLDLPRAGDQARAATTCRRRPGRSSRPCSRRGDRA